MNNVEKVKNIIETVVKDPNKVWPIPKNKGWIGNIYKPYEEIDTNRASIHMGNCMEVILNQIIPVKHGDSSVSFYIAGWGATEKEVKEKERADFDKIARGKKAKPRNVQIFTRADIAKVLAIIREDVDLHKHTPDNNDEVRYSQKDLAKLSERIMREVPLTDTLTSVSVDMCPLINGEYWTIETKLSGDTDSTKTPAFIAQHIILPYICLGDKKKKAYFGVMSSNKDPQKEWKAIPSKYMQSELILVEDALYRTLAPYDISFYRFQTMLEDRVMELKP